MSAPQRSSARLPRLTSHFMRAFALLLSEAPRGCRASPPLRSDDSSPDALWFQPHCLLSTATQAAPTMSSFLSAKGPLRPYRSIWWTGCP